MRSMPLPKLHSALVGILSLLATASLAQTTIHVGPGQTYTTIQSGIDAANNGDTVLVASGTYNENINFDGKAITVTSSGGAAVTIIDGGAAPGLAVVAFERDEGRASILSNFTVRNGGLALLPRGLAEEYIYPERLRQFSITSSLRTNAMALLPIMGLP